MTGGRARPREQSSLWHSAHALHEFDGKTCYMASTNVHISDDLSSPI